MPGTNFEDLRNIHLYNWILNFAPLSPAQLKCNPDWFQLARQVVGGGDHGGVLVRSGSELTSELAETRLSTGAVVKVGVESSWGSAHHRLPGQELENRDGRICYELIRGDGPPSGWVSSKLRGKVGF